MNTNYKAAVALLKLQEIGHLEKLNTSIEKILLRGLTLYVFFDETGKGICLHLRVCAVDFSHSGVMRFHFISPPSFDVPPFTSSFGYPTIHIVHLEFNESLEWKLCFRGHDRNSCEYLLASIHVELGHQYESGPGGD